MYRQFLFFIAMFTMAAGIWSSASSVHATPPVRDPNSVWSPGGDPQKKLRTALDDYERWSGLFEKLSANNRSNLLSRAELILNQSGLLVGCVNYLSQSNPSAEVKQTFQTELPGLITSLRKRLQTLKSDVTAAGAELSEDIKSTPLLRNECKIVEDNVSDAAIAAIKYLLNAGDRSSAMRIFDAFGGRIGRHKKLDDFVAPTTKPANSSDSHPVSEAQAIRLTNLVEAMLQSAKREDEQAFLALQLDPSKTKSWYAAHSGYLAMLSDSPKIGKWKFEESGIWSGIISTGNEETTPLELHVVQGLIDEKLYVVLPDCIEHFLTPQERLVITKSIEAWVAAVNLKDIDALSRLYINPPLAKQKLGPGLAATPTLHFNDRSSWNVKRISSGDKSIRVRCTNLSNEPTLRDFEVELLIIVRDQQATFFLKD